MFDSAYIKHLKDEIAFLREMLKEKNFISPDPMPPIRLVDPLTGKIEEMTAETEEEKKQREDALNDIYELETNAGALI